MSATSHKKLQYRNVWGEVETAFPMLVDFLTPKYQYLKKSSTGHAVPS